MGDGNKIQKNILKIKDAGAANDVIRRKNA
jgi:hypothetical protein